MHRFRVPEIFLGCFLTVAVFAAGTLFNRQQPSQPQQAVAQQAAASQGHKTETPDAELTWSTWLTKDAAGFFTFGLVIIGISQAFLFFIQLRYMRKGMEDATTAARAAKISADAAMKTAEISERLLAQNDRAWVSVQAEIVSNLDFADDLVSIEIGINLTNVGKSPATHIEYMVQLCPDIIEARTVGEKAIARVGSGILNFGIVLFPNDRTPDADHKLTMPVADFRNNITEANELVASQDMAVTHANPAIMVCVAYRLAASPRTRHTLILFEIRHINDTHGGWAGDNVKVSLPYLRLVQNFMSGQVT